MSMIEQMAWESVLPWELLVGVWLPAFLVFLLIAALVAQEETP